MDCGMSTPARTCTRACHLQIELLSIVTGHAGQHLAVWIVLSMCDKPARTCHLWLALLLLSTRSGLTWLAGWLVWVNFSSLDPTQYVTSHICLNRRLPCLPPEGKGDKRGQPCAQGIAAAVITFLHCTQQLL